MGESAPDFGEELPLGGLLDGAEVVEAPNMRFLASLYARSLSLRDFFCRSRAAWLLAMEEPGVLAGRFRILSEGTNAAGGAGDDVEDDES